MKHEPKSHCSRCRVLFKSNEKGTWVEITGWVVVRQRGGANAVRDRRETGNVLCPRCGKERELKIIPGQESLL
jgi:hypothetical protein